MDAIKCGELLFFRLLVLLPLPFNTVPFPGPEFCFFPVIRIRIIPCKVRFFYLFPEFRIGFIFYAQVTQYLFFVFFVLLINHVSE